MTRRELLTLYVLLITGLSCAFVCTGNHNPSKVLVLQSYHVGQPMEDGFVRGLRKAADSSGQWIEFHYEYMDGKRYTPPLLDSILEFTYATKYADKCFNALITADNIALEFAFRHRDRLFKDLPLIFLGVNGFGPTTTAGQNNLTGIAEDNDIPGTLDLMKQLQPDVRDIYLITDLTETGNRMRALAEKQLAQDSYWKPHWLQNETYESLLDSLAKPSGMAIVLTFSIDREKKLFSEAQFFGMLGAKSQKPVFAMLEHQVRKGIVGGEVLSGEEHGRIAGDMLLQILHGVPADSIPILEQSPKMLLVDYDALERFQIDPARVPASTVLLHAPFSLWKEYRSMIVAALVVFVLLISIIAVLIMTRKKLKESRQHYRALVERASTVILSMDRCGNVLYMNEYGEKLFGYNLKDIRGKNILETIVPRIETSGRMLSSMIDDLFQHPDLLKEMENENVTADGRTLWMRWSHKVVLDWHGAPEYILSVGIDMTEKHRRDEEIARFNRKVAHDLRTPLVTISGFAGSILDDLHEEGLASVERNVHYIQNAASKMGNLLNDLAKMFRSGEVRHDHERFLLSEVVDEARKLVAGRVKASNLKIKTSTDAWLTGERERLIEVFQNLLDNAAKFMGNQTSPEVEIGLEDHQGILTIFVRDNGVGVPADKVEELFQPYLRLDPDITGTGLGLAIVRQIIHAHGGRIWIESMGLGQGSSIFIQLPQMTLAQKSA